MADGEGVGGNLGMNVELTKEAVTGSASQIAVELRSDSALGRLGSGSIAEGRVFVPSQE